MNNPLNRRLEKKEKEDSPDFISKETDPLLPAGRNSSNTLVRRNKSPTQQLSQSPSLISPSFVGIKREIRNNNNLSMISNTRLLDHDNDNDAAATAEHDGYESIDDVSIPSHQLSSANNSEDPYCTTDRTESFISAKSSTGVAELGAPIGNNGGGGSRGNPPSVSGSHHTNESKGGGGRIPPDTRSIGSADSEQPPLLEIPEEVYAVRKAALQVLKPLNKTWVVISVGFALTVLFGMSKWSRLLPTIPFWFIILPCWLSHVGLLWLHILSARALSAFIAEANDSRQRPDSRDHLNRTEYLPLLQRSLKFGLKTGLLSFCMFLFEILMYVRVARGTISLSVAFIPLWFLVIGGILDGLICKSQHILRVVCWLLTFCAMILTVLKIDYGFDNIRWRLVVSPIITVLTLSSASLIYIVYGHQIGYYRLTEAQLTAGNLYSLAALICIILIVMIGEVIPLSRPVEIETRVFVVVLAPLVVCLVGMGAWVISRDEYGRLLLYGGQSAVHPMMLRWEVKGWTSVQGRGVTVIPMFGEVSFQPLEKKPTTDRPSSTEKLSVCTRCVGRCYPTEDGDEEKQHLTDDIGYHPYLESSHSRASRNGFNNIRSL